MKEEDLIMARNLVAESQEASPSTSPVPLRRNRVQDILERRSQFRWVTISFFSQKIITKNNNNLCIHVFENVIFKLYIFIVVVLLWGNSELFFWQFMFNFRMTLCTFVYANLWWILCWFCLFFWQFPVCKLFPPKTKKKKIETWFCLWLLLLSIFVCYEWILVSMVCACGMELKRNLQMCLCGICITLKNNHVICLWSLVEILPYSLCNI